MNTYSKIFLDLDDVLNQFTLPALRFVGCQIDSERDYPRDVGYNLVAAANRLMPPGSAPLTWDSFWQKIPRSFWASVPRSDEFDWLIAESIAHVGPRRVFILTAPIEDPECFAGKQEWILANVPKSMREQVLIGKPKFCCAKPSHLLIDDSAKNCREFVEEHGAAFLVPRPWNEAYPRDEWMSQLKRVLRSDQVP